MDGIRLIGGVLVIVSGIGLGSCPVREMNERKREFESMVFCFLRLKSEISHAQKPLPEAFRTIGQRDGKKSLCKCIFTRLSEAMTEGTENYSTLLDTILPEVYAHSVIKRAEMERLIEVFRSLGGPDRERQVEVIGFYIEELRTLCADEVRRKKEKAYLYRMLGFLFGIFVTVMLY